MNLLNDEELLQLSEELGVTIHDSVDALSAYELKCIKSDTAKMPRCFTVHSDLHKIDGTVQAYY
jgi:hypothetical protein